MDQQNNDFGRINIDTEASELSPDYQKFISDENPIKESFYTTFCGHRYIIKPIKTLIMGQEEVQYERELIIDEKSRVMNEACAEYIYGAIKPLISPVTQHSNLTPIQIYNLWRGKIRVIRHTLINSIYFDGNPYEIRQYRISDIITTIIENYAITANATGGFKLKEMRESFITSVIRRNSEIPQHQEGILDRLSKKFNIN